MYNLKMPYYKKYLPVFLISFIICYLNYANYYLASEHGELNNIHAKVMNGTANAPYQYRLIMHYAVDFIERFMPELTIRRIFAGLDSLFIILSFFVLCNFWKKENFWETGHHFDFLLPAIFSLYPFLFLGIYHSWQVMSSLLYVCIFCFIFLNYKKASHYINLSVLLILVSAVQSFNRPDICFALSLGFIIGSTLNKNRDKAFFITCLLILFTSITVQIYLKYYLFPEASYPKSLPAIQFFQNFRCKLLIPFIMFITPFAYGAFKFVQNDLNKKFHCTYYLLVSGLVYFLIWAILGRLVETRIFIPFAVPLITLFIYGARKWYEQP